MKRTILLLLALAMALSLFGCAAKETAAEAEAAPTADHTPGYTNTPTPTATDEPAADAAAISVTIERESQIFTDDTGADTLLNYFADRARVSLPDDPTAEARINTALEEDHRLFAEGDEEQEWSGKEGFADGARQEYAMRIADGTTDGFTPYALERTMDVMRGDDRVLSLTYLDYSFAGGAHGYGALRGVNFDVRTGEKLTLGDLAEDPSGFLDQCADFLWEDSRRGEHTFLALGGYFDDYEQTLPALLQDGGWYFSQEGIVVIANPYDIAPYAAGRISFTLPWDWLRWRIKEEYVPRTQTVSGTLAGEIVSTAPTADYMVDDNTNGQGACVLFTADGPVEEVRLTRVSWMEYNNSFLDEGTLWYASHMNSGEVLALRTWIGDVVPTLKISWRQEDGAREEKLIFQSGKDGSLVLLDGRAHEVLPLEISHRLPFDYDVDGDGETETLDLVNTGENGRTHWAFTVNGLPAADVYALDAETMYLWLTDMDDDGVAEILFSGDLGSDDYITCGWHGDTLEPILFTGETRRGQDPAEQTATVDGFMVFSGWQMYLESWSYQLGTYAAVREYEYKDGLIAPAHDPWGGFDGWHFLRNRTWLTVTSPVNAFWPDGGETPLENGTEILITGTDGNHVFFTTRDGRTGALELQYGSYGDGFSGWLIGGVPEDEFFQMLPYAG